MDAASPQLPRLGTLTAREHEVLHWVAEGKSNGDIGRILGCTERTVKKHLQHIFPKLGVETRTAAARTYLQESSRAA
jgi:DNA-binding CsgD family transcriptional regulator